MRQVNRYASWLKHSSRFILVTWESWAGEQDSALGRLYHLNIFLPASPMGKGAGKIGQGASRSQTCYLHTSLLLPFHSLDSATSRCKRGGEMQQEGEHGFWWGTSCLCHSCKKQMVPLTCPHEYHLATCILKLSPWGEVLTFLKALCDVCYRDKADWKLCLRGS